MSDEHALIGRTGEQEQLDQALNAAWEGGGGIVLLAGEAGVGKTRLLEECLSRSGLLALRGQASEIASPPYGPISAALRVYLRQRPGDRAAFGPLAAQLALLLAELGPAPAQSDPALLGETLCQAFAAISSRNPAALVLDDLQWADNATLELLPLLANAMAHQRMLIIAMYRSDEVGRGHPLRRLRNELRRARVLREITVAPLDHDETAALAAGVLGQPPGPALAQMLFERTEGVPLYVKELAEALVHQGRLRQERGRIELAPGAELPVPETLRDAVLLRLDGLAEATRQLLDLAAVAGQQFSLALLAELAGNTEGFDALLEAGLLIEVEPGLGAFRHALIREAIYGDIYWGRRRALHRQLAERLASEGAAPLAVAQHWLAAQEPDPARAALLEATEQACAIHAYRDAAAAAGRALELWPSGVEEERRLLALDRLGQATQLCGMLPEAARAWRELADGQRLRGDLVACAGAERKLAAIAELQSHWEGALAARETAARLFAASAMPAEAAAERLTAAAHLRSAARYRGALELLTSATEEAAMAGRPDLQARIMGLEGNVRGRMGQAEAGLELVRRALAVALEHNLVGPVAEIYQRLADTLEHAGDYSAARQTYQTAFQFCQTNAISATAQVCIACLTVVLRQTGEWDRAMTLCREVLASEHSTAHARGVASCILGTLYVLRGQPTRGQALLIEAAALAQQIELAALETISAWGLGLLHESSEDYVKVAEYGRFVLNRCDQVEDVHYIVPALRWTVSFFASSSADAEARSGANTLARIASETGQPEALAALAHALGEIALLDGDPAQAAQQFRQALDLLGEDDDVFSYASTQFRAGVALLAAGQEDAASGQFESAYRLARKLGARPLAARIAGALAATGSRRASRESAADLTRRQREILQLVALGQSNAEIAHTLTLSPRTVEMHVANIIAALDSRSRTEAVSRAAELGLLEEYRSAARKIP